MKKVLNAFFAIATVFLLTVQAQDYTFENYTIPDTLDAIGWGGMVAEIAVDPLNAGNKVLKFTPNNYNAAPVLKFELAKGKTLADCPALKFKAYFAKGDVGWKHILVEAYPSFPKGRQAFKVTNPDTLIGDYNRATGASTGWEEITIELTGSSNIKDSVFIAFGINCAGKSGDDTTIWYADDVDLVGNTASVVDSISVWGALKRKSSWKIDTLVTAPGSAGMYGDKHPEGNWATLIGKFPLTQRATVSEAVIVQGVLEFKGDGPRSWGGLRYGIFNYDSLGAHKYAGTDSARWEGKENAHGYLFTPRSGTNSAVSWASTGNGEVGANDGDSWITTNGGTCRALLTVNPKPARAEITAGKYNFAISVQDKGDGTNELKFYMYKQGTPVKYWFGGSVIDTGQVTTDFNGIAFGINNGNGIENTKITGLYVSDVIVTKGNPITIPEAPWEAYYVDRWGILGKPTSWKLQPGEFEGDAGMGGEGGKPTTSWNCLYGEFFEPVTATKDRAVSVTGEIEFFGAGPTTWSPFRYAVFYNENAGTLYNPGTDSAYFDGNASNVYGYGMMPRSGVTDQISGQGGNGNLWSIKGGSYNSSWSGGNRTMGVFVNNPARAEMTAGVYEWGVSIQAVTDTTTEVRWYIQKKIGAGEEQTSFWQGGTAIDPRGASLKFNAVAFAINNNAPDDLDSIKVYKVKVDLGNPITIPPKPWLAYYLDEWGVIGAKSGGWKLVPGEFVGDVSISGDNPPDGWAAIRGGFLEPVELVDKSFVVKGKIRLTGGGFEDLASLRYGVFYSETAGALKIDPNLDSNKVWSGSDDGHTGILIVPPSGTNVPHWGSFPATAFGVGNDDVWLYYDAPNGYPLSDQTWVQDPENGVGAAGTYNFAISITPDKSGVNMVKYTLDKTDGTYYFSGTSSVRSTKANKFNCVAFAINNSTTTGLELEKIQIDFSKEPINRIEPSSGNPELPTVYALKQNYPNPFNPTTNIRFDLPKDSDVNLVVYDLMGREVAKLVNNHLNAGYYTINFNAANLPSGVYIYRLKAGDFVSTKKLMLLK
jgi:hypothetical protein